MCDEAMPEILKQRCLTLLRDLRMEHGSCYHDYRTLADELECRPEDLFNPEENTGPLQELHDTGAIHIVVQGEDTCAIAEADFF